jgi:hypothetical protein
MVFIDYKGQKIELTTEAWEIHIKENHPDITVSEIEETLKNPDEVWESQNRTDTELYYKRKKTSVSGKIRYWMVAVKKVNSGSFVSSAMTKSTVVGSKLLYKKTGGVE